MTRLSNIIFSAVFFLGTCFADAAVTRAHGQATGCDPRVNQGCK